MGTVTDLKTDVPEMPRIHSLLEQKGHVVTAEEDKPVYTAVELMSRYQVGCVVVVDESRRITGIISERDVINKVCVKHRDVDKVTIREVMTSEVIHCTHDTPIVEAQQIMAANGIRHLPIIQNGEPVGMISSRDILAHQLSSVADIARLQNKLFERLERVFPGLKDFTERAPVA